MRGDEKLPLLCSFSLYSNVHKILSLEPSSSREILFLNGIRSISMLSIVLGHTYMICFWLSPTLNSHAMLDWLTNGSSMFVLAGFEGVDTFFMITAILLTLSIFKELDRT